MSIQEIHNRLIKKKETLSLAESLTGGAISFHFVKNAGCSSYFKGSVVAYSGEAKMEVLGVSPETLKRYGEVSIETAKEMAEGALRIFHTDYAVSVTGIAGPMGGSTIKPVGLVIFAIAIKNKSTFLKSLQFSGVREEIISKTVAQAIEMLLGVIHD